MLYFEERVQKETFKPIRPNHRSIFLLLFSPYLRVGYLWCPSLSWGFLRISAHPHPYVCQQCLPGAQQGNTVPLLPPWTHCLSHTVEDNEQVAPWYPIARKAKLKMPPSMPSSSQCFGAAQGCCGLSAAQLYRWWLHLSHPSSLGGTPWPWQLMPHCPVASDVSPAVHCSARPTAAALHCNKVFLSWMAGPCSAPSILHLI